MKRWCTLAALLLAVAGCGGRDDAVARCHELKPKLTADAAWRDIDATNAAAAEWLDLHCADLVK